MLEIAFTNRFAFGDSPATYFAGRSVMITELHPSDVVLLALAAGTLDKEQRIAIDDLGTLSQIYEDVIRRRIG